MASPHKRRGKKVHGGYGKVAPAKEVSEVAAPEVAAPEVEPAPKPKKKKKSIFG